MKPLAQFSYVALRVLCTPMYMGHMMLALNRFTLFYAPTRYETLWTAERFRVVALLIWISGLLCPVPAFILAGDQIQYWPLNNGIILMFGGKFSEYDGYQVMCWTCMIFTVCIICYGYSFWKVTTSNIASSVERKLLLCAFFSSVPFFLEFMVCCILWFSPPSKTGILWFPPKNSSG